MTTPFEVPSALQDVIRGNTTGEYTPRRENARPYPAENKPAPNLTGPAQAVVGMGGTITSPAPPSAVTTPPAGLTQGPTAPAAGKTAEQQAQDDAFAILMDVLTEYGLQELEPVIREWVTKGLSEAEIIREMRGTKRYKERFKANDARRKKGLAPLSERDYIAYERDARQLMRAAGLPEGFYDSNDDVLTYLENDLSISELGDRVTLAANAAFRMPAEDRAALEAWGMGPGDITAFWLDPDVAQPLLERKYAAAQLAGASRRTGFGTLRESTATDLATQGVTVDQAEQGFSTLADSRELFTSLDRGEDRIGQGEQLDAMFGGNAKAQRRIEQRRARRKAQFEGGGSFAAGQGGIAGLGSAEF